METKLALPKQFRKYVEPRLPPDIEPAWYVDSDDSIPAVKGATAIWLSFNQRAAIAATLHSGRQLRWVSTHAAGVETFPLELFRERRIELTSGAGIGSVPVSEFVVLGMLAAAKNFPAFVRAQDLRQWPTRPPGSLELADTRALIVGYGHIGQAVANRLRSFEVDVVGVRRHPHLQSGDLGHDEWRGQLGRFNWIILTAALTNETRHLIGARELGLMRSDAWVVNVGRGGLCARH